MHYAGRHFEKAVGGPGTRYYNCTLGKTERLVAFRRGGVLRWAGQDHLGSTVRVADQGWAPVDQARYLPFGQDRDPGANLATDQKFTGQVQDTSTGLYWFASRYYDPALTRFAQPDGVVPDYTEPQSLNRYSYVLNNPLKLVDPSGHVYEDYPGQLGAHEYDRRPAAPVAQTAGAAGFVEANTQLGASPTWSQRAAWAAADAVDSGTAAAIAVEDVSIATAYTILFGSATRRPGPDGTIIIENSGGLLGGFARTVGGEGNTLTYSGSLIVSTTDVPVDSDLQRHEMGHIQSARNDGPFWLLNYAEEQVATAIRTRSLDAATLHKENRYEVFADQWAGTNIR